MQTQLKPEFIRSLRDAAEFIQSSKLENRTLSRSEQELWSGLTTPEIIISLLDQIEQDQSEQDQSEQNSQQEAA